MILQSLYNYYQVLRDDPEVDIASPGYSASNISFALNLSHEGELLNIIPLPSKVFDGRRTRDVNYQRMIVPEQVKRAGKSPKPNFLWDNSAFILGISDKDQDDPKYGPKRFDAFRDFNIEILSQADSDIARTVIAFLRKHEPQSARKQEVISRHLDDLLKGGNLIFRVDARNALDDPEILRVWDEYRMAEKAVKMQCLVTGEVEQIARLHPGIQGVRDAQATGASLVSFNLDAFTSYGREQGLNSPVSQRAASGYSVALNYLLSKQNPNPKIQLGDTTVVYWADTSDKRYASAFYTFLNPEYQKEEEEASEESQGKRRRATEEEKKLGKVATTVQIGRAINLATLNEGLDASTRFYVLGLAPNAARLSVRFFLTEPFGVFAERIMQHYKDLEIEKEFSNQPTYLSPYRILAECVSPKVNRRDEEVKKSWSLLGGMFIRSILTGAPYPEGLYTAILNRVRHDTDEEKRSVKTNYVRVAYIKAHLLRKYHRQTQNPYQEALQMSLNPTYTNPAYVLGRLFAVLEKAQLEAVGQSINATIKDRYFTSACATPASVFPTLLRLSHHHTGKAQYGSRLDRQIQDLLNLLDAQPFPAHFSLEEQGVFILGYYHQRNAFYTKNNDKSEEIGLSEVVQP